MPPTRPGPQRNAWRYGLLVAATATTACYSYQPVRTAEPLAPGQEVRIRYLEPELHDPAPWERRGTRSTTLMGRVLQWDDQVVLLAVYPLPTTFGMSRASPYPDTIPVPLRGIMEVEIRELNRRRVAVFAVGGTVAGAFLVRGLFNWTRRSPPPPPEGS